MAAIISQRIHVAPKLTQKSRTRFPRAAAARTTRNTRSFAVTAEARPIWFPGSTAPAHLDGSLPGDYGFDPLSLGKEPEDLKWYVQAELMHARWAMLGLAGMVAPELLGNPFVDGPLPNWHEAPFYTGYFADTTTLFITQMILMNWAEVRRWQDIKNPGSVNQDPLFEANVCPGKDVGYPGGGWFDPLGYAKDESKMRELRTKEIANGRLAMVAVFGVFIQYDVTGVGPIANLNAHLADPYHVTIFQNFTPFQ